MAQFLKRRERVNRRGHLASVDEAVEEVVEETPKPKKRRKRKTASEFFGGLSAKK